MRQHTLRVATAVPEERGTGTEGADGAPEGAPSARAGGGEDPRTETGEPPVRGAADRRRPAPVVLPAGQPGNRAEDPAPGEPDGGAGPAPAQPDPAAVLRTGDAEPDVAKRPLHVPAGRQIRLRRRLPGRLLTVRGEPRPLPQPDRGGRDRDVPRGRRGIQSPEGNADRPRPAVSELAGQEPLRRGTHQGPGGASRLPAAASDDPRQGGAVLGHHVAGVFGPGPVRLVRVGQGTAETLGAVLQPPAAAPGDRGPVPRRPLL